MRAAHLLFRMGIEQVVILGAMSPSEAALSEMHSEMTLTDEIGQAQAKDTDLAAIIGILKGSSTETEKINKIRKLRTHMFYSRNAHRLMLIDDCLYSYKEINNIKFC